jgi:HD-GYP domain-containing protein (c-di-GMP phosphodiesterase class II)
MSAAPVGVVAGQRLAALLGTLSLATDMANGQAPEQCLRIALVATRLAKAGGESAQQQETTYWTAVLRYLGCISFAVEEAGYAAGDDIGLRASFLYTDFGQPKQVLGAVVRDFGRGAPLTQRVGGIARFLTSPKAPHEHALAQCDAGMHLARKLGMTGEVVLALGQADERFDGRGLPHRLRGDALTRAVRHVELARVAVLFHGLAGVPGALAELRRRAGGHLDPDLVQRFERDATELCGGLAQSSVWSEFLAIEPGGQRTVSVDSLEPLLAAFAQFADLKSTFGAGHSTAVSQLAVDGARAQGLAANEIQALGHAALLHDLGRVCVPTGLWDKPGPLTPSEWERVRLHAYFTERVLRQSPALSSLADIASHAHERLDGTGYPRGDRASTIDRATRLLAAADSYNACSQPRPYRPAMARDAIERELRAAVSAGRLCPRAVDAVLGVAGHSTRATAPRVYALSEREIEVIRLLASGLTNKQIAKQLGISPRTVQHHTVHIYDKIGVASRAGAALYAAEHGLVAGF